MKKKCFLPFLCLHDGKSVENSCLFFQSRPVRGRTQGKRPVVTHGQRVSGAAEASAAVRGLCAFLRKRRRFHVCRYGVFARAPAEDGVLQMRLSAGRCAPAASWRNTSVVRRGQGAFARSCGKGGVFTCVATESLPGLLALCGRRRPTDASFCGKRRAGRVPRDTWPRYGGRCSRRGRRAVLR